MPLIAFLLIAAVSLPAQRPRYGGTITIETQESSSTLDPASLPAMVSSLVYDCLVTLDDRGQPRAGLAVSWTPDPSTRRWQFRLSNRIFAHDGTAITAQSLAAALAPVLTGRTVTAFGDSIVIQSPEPAPRLLYELALPRRAVALRTSAGAPVGTGPFRVAEWDPGRRLLLTAFDEHRNGRPFLDAVEILLGKPHAEQLRDLELGRAHVVELLPADARRQQQRGRRVWTSRPQELLAMAWRRDRSAAQSAALRQALALSIDRPPILNVLLQRHGEVAGAILPQWLTGYAFLFPTARDVPRARSLIPNGSPGITLYCDPEDSALRPIGDRIALNARDAGLTVRVVTARPADIELQRVPLVLNDAAAALENAAKATALPLSLDGHRLESLHKAEQTLVQQHWIVPLFHVPAIFGISSKVNDRTPARALRWSVEEAWIAEP
jgi:MarR-like DNA-binding transcriptional regulator SgrR of sgrS sRNA